jgi:hypothetical protein
MADARKALREMKEVQQRTLAVDNKLLQKKAQQIRWPSTASTKNIKTSADAGDE